MPDPRSLRRAAAPLVLGLSLGALVLVTYRFVLDLAFLGWDGWPLVAAGRVESAGDLWRLVSSELMDGRYPFGRFWRPVTHLAFALDRALHGLTPRGYHATDLALLALNATLLAILGRRLAGSLAGAAAGVLFVLHPIQLELLPVPARRADTLCLLFLLAALLAERADERAASRARALCVGALAFLAVGAKETGAIVAPVVFAWHLSAARGGGWGARARLALRRTLPALAGVALHVALRLAVLGGLGGHRGPVGAAAVPAQRLVGGVVERALHPQPVLGAGAVELALVGLAAVALAVTLRRAARGAMGGDGGARPFATALFLGAWALAVLALTALADRLHDWYAMLLVAPWALALGLALERGRSAWRAGRRPVGGAALALVAVLAAGPVLTSAALRPYPLLRNASALAEQLYGQLTRGIGEGDEGQVVQLIPWVPQVPPRPDGHGVRSLHLFTDYTLQAWCELHWPRTRFRVSAWAGRGLAAEPDVLQVQLVPGAVPSWVTKIR